ncbi:hypothetical protein BC829DRAFT_414165 [Chytridium lagenaria]|nr:hypothetical protein BC829DRAFT_414165 [Chytridium lagenaria]
MFGMPKSGTTTLLRKLLKKPPFDPNAKKIYEPEHASIEGRICHILEASQYRGTPFYDILIPEFKKTTQRIIFVADLTSPSTFPLAKQELSIILRDPFLLGKPVVVFGSMMDRKEAVSVGELTRALGIEEDTRRREKVHGRAVEVFGLSVRDDKGWQQGMRWLLKQAPIPHRIKSE